MIKRIASAGSVAAVAVSALVLAAAPTYGQQQQEQQRLQQQRQQQAAMPTGQVPMQFQEIQGTIQDVKRAQVKGAQQENVLLLIQTAEGQKAVIDAGVGIEEAQLQEGQQIEARGHVVHLGQQRTVLLANQIQVAGQDFDVNRPAFQQPQQQQQQQQQPGAQ